MTRPRRELVSLEATPYYHCVSRCVRRAFLCGEDSHSGRNFDHRKQWIVDRLLLLAEIFAIDIAAYAVMSNHYHVVLRIDRDTALGWDRDEILRRWYQLFAGHHLADRYRAGTALSVPELQALDELVELWRERLHDLGWFMRCLNERIARQANEEDQCSGRFWEGRYKSQALLDEAAVLACMAYVDLNPIRAGLAKTPETSEFTALHARIEKSKAVAATQSESADKQTSPLTPNGLLPFNGQAEPKHPESALPYDFLDYLALVDWTGRAIREDKRGAIPESLAPILARLNIETDNWLETVCRLEGRIHRVLGPAEQVRACAEALGQKWLQGITHCLQFYRASLA
jgi:REP element-mobilizing transposase RayT